jgi:hypothetical protein
MATRSTIAMATAEGIRSVYVHWDGYPDGVGATLENHYQDVEKLERLMSIGDISSLREDIGEQHDFNSASDVTTFYGRDRGEDTPSVMHENIGVWLEHRRRNGCEYGYFWNGEKFLTYTL